jgi:hypothetical protein
MTNRTKILLTLLAGIVFGLISVIMGQIPKTIAVWSGMRVLGNTVGYSLLILAVVYFYSQTWRRGFIAGSLVNLVATIMYYVPIYIILELSPTVVSHQFSIYKFVQWTVIGVICAALAATAVRLLIYGKTRLIKYGALIAAYLGLMFAIYVQHVIGFMNGYKNGFLERHNETVAGSIFEIAFAFVLTTALFVIAFRKYRHVGAADNPPTFSRRTLHKRVIKE